MKIQVFFTAFFILLFSVYFIFFFHGNVFYGQDVVINEIMASNDDILDDQDGDFSDWIELYNPSDDAINLIDFTMSDNADELNKWVFPSVEIPAQGFLLVFASGKDVTVGELHANFKLKQTGEAIYLSNSNGEVISSVESVGIPTDRSFGAVIDGNVNFAISIHPTPNQSNFSSNAVFCSKSSGFYTNDIEVILTPADSAVEIRYTLNGSLPSADSQLYTSSMVFSNNTDSLSISMIPTTPLEGPYPLSTFIWKAPEEVYQSNVLRYASFQGDQQVSQVYSKTFFIDPNITERYSFPITSLITDSLNLFDYEQGVYVPGQYFDENGFNYFPTGNYLLQGMENEKEIHLTYFDKNGGVSYETDAGMRIRGYSSTSFPQKSFNVYFRSGYGLSKIDEPIFEDKENTEFKRLVYRNSGNDFTETHFRDALLQSILSPLDLELQSFQPSILFINGEYWGIHNIREKYGKHYFKNNLDIEPENLNILKFSGEVAYGVNFAYEELRDFVETNDMSIEENYNYVKEIVDIHNFIDYNIAEIFFAHYDWPCNNYKIWNTNDEGSKYRFLIYDLDLSTGITSQMLYDQNSLVHATTAGGLEWPFCDISNFLLRNLLSNQDFEDQFLAQFTHNLNTVFDPITVNEKINDFEMLFDQEMEEHINRWSYPKTRENWEENIEVLREFFLNRQCVMRNQLVDFFEKQEMLIDCSTYYAETHEITIYPNPVQNQLALSFPNKMEQYKIFQIEGSIVQSGHIESNRIDVSNLAAGLYILKMYNESLEETMKFVKE